jgi:hypothetical protein
MKTFFQSLLTAIIGGGITGAAQTIATGSTKGIAWTAGAGAILSAAALLKQSPLAK